MNEITTIQNYPLTILSSIFCLAIIVFQFFSWKVSIRYSDPTYVFVSLLLSGVLMMVVVTIPVKEHIQLHNISKFDIMETERFVKLFDKETDSEIFQTTDHYTITNIKKWTHVQHKWDTNILGYNILGNNYSLVQK